MFKIQYLILEEEQKRIAGIKRALNWEIEGQICLYFHKKVIGFYEEEIDIGEEYLFLWFRMLLETVKQLKQKDESYANIPESTKVLHFVLKGDKLEVIKGEMALQCLNEKVKVYSSFDMLKVYWEENISFNEFQKEILDKTEQFIAEVSFYNKRFSKTMDYKILMDLLFECGWDLNRFWKP